MSKSYEAWDFNNGICIYNGGCSPTLISEINKYAKCQKKVELNIIKISDIYRLNNRLKYAGIQIYIN